MPRVSGMVRIVVGAVSIGEFACVLVVGGEVVVCGDGNADVELAVADEGVGLVLRSILFAVRWDRCVTF